jgi:hypothetical protein
VSWSRLLLYLDAVALGEHGRNPVQRRAVAVQVFGVPVVACWLLAVIVFGQDCSQTSGAYPPPLIISA